MNFSFYKHTFHLTTKYVRKLASRFSTDITFNSQYTAATKMAFNFPGSNENSQDNAEFDAFDAIKAFDGSEAAYTAVEDALKKMGSKKKEYMQLMYMVINQKDATMRLFALIANHLPEEVTIKEFTGFITAPFYAPPSNSMVEAAEKVIQSTLFFRDDPEGMIMDNFRATRDDIMEEFISKSNKLDTNEEKQTLWDEDYKLRIRKHVSDHQKLYGEEYNFMDKL